MISPVSIAIGRSMLLSLILFTAGASAAEYPFTGRWRMDTISLIKESRPTEFRLQGGYFKKSDNGPIKADGRLYSVPGSDYVDETSIAIRDSYNVKQVDRVKGKLAYIVDYLVSQDGETLTTNSTNYTNPKGQPVRIVAIQRRVGARLRGAHLMTGKWESVSLTGGPDNDWILTLKGNRFNWRTEGGDWV